MAYWPVRSCCCWSEMRRWSLRSRYCLSSICSWNWACCSDNVQTSPNSSWIESSLVVGACSAGAAEGAWDYWQVRKSSSWPAGTTSLSIRRWKGAKRVYLFLIELSLTHSLFFEANSKLRITSSPFSLRCQMWTHQLEL